MSLAEELFDLDGQVALVTGASSGLGWRFGEVLAGQGAKVVLAARRSERLAQLQTVIEAAGGVAHCVELDVTGKDAISEAFDQAEKFFGTVTLLVNNAGISGQKKAVDMSDADWRGVMDVNLDAVWRASQEAARRLIKAGKPGSIINITSILGFQVAQSLSAYAVAKAGVVQITKALAVEYARHNIRVNAIAPGYIRTEINEEFFASEKSGPLVRQIPQRRIGSPEDLDASLMLLASEKASGFMTGSTIVVDGGHMWSMG